MRRSIFYGALALVLTAAGVTLAVIGGSDEEILRAVAQPPDNPGDTAPGRPTTTEPDPVVESPIERVEIKGRFGEACGDNGLCYEITRPSQSLTNVLTAGGEPRSRIPTVDDHILLNGEAMTHGTFSPCQLGSTSLSFGASWGAEETDYGYLVAGTLAVNTPTLDVDGLEIYQLEVDSTAVGGPQQIFVAKLTKMTLPEFQALTDSHVLATEEEVEAITGRPYKHQSCGGN